MNAKELDDNTLSIDCLKIYTKYKLLLCHDKDSIEIRNKNNFTYVIEKPEGIEYKIKECENDCKILTINTNIKHIKNIKNKKIINYYNKVYDERKYLQYDKIIESYDKLINQDNIIQNNNLNSIEINKSKNKIIKISSEKLLIIRKSKIEIAESKNYKNLHKLIFHKKIYVSDKENWIENLIKLIKNTENTKKFSCLIISNKKEILEKQELKMKDITIISYKEVESNKKYKKRWNVIIYDLYEINYEKIETITRKNNLISKLEIYKIKCKNDKILRFTLIDFLNLLIGENFNNVINYYEDKYEDLLNNIIFFDKKEIDINKKQLIINRECYNYNKIESYIFDNDHTIHKIGKYIDEIGKSFYNTKPLKEKDKIETECTICMNEIESYQMCILTCNHSICYKCMCKIYILNKTNSKCPLCRQKYEIHMVQPVENNIKYSKIEKLMNNLERDIKIYKKIVIYTKEILFEEIKNQIENQINCYKIDGKRKEKNNIINEINKIKEKVIILSEAKDNIYIKQIKDIDKIIVLDREYEYILKRESLGYNFNNNRSGVILDIYEVKNE